MPDVSMLCTTPCLLDYFAARGVEQDRPRPQPRQTRRIEKSRVSAVNARRSESTFAVLSSSSDGTSGPGRAERFQATASMAKASALRMKVVPMRLPEADVNCSGQKAS
jgi:hypothetical protein